MSSWVIIIPTILIATGLGMATAWYCRHRHYHLDYYSIFVLGVVWFFLGLPLNNSVLSALGGVFMILGLTHRDKWNKSETFYQAESNILKITVLLGITFLIIIGTIFYLMRG